MVLVKRLCLGRLAASPVAQISLEGLAVPDFFPLSLSICVCVLGSM